jgi:hypothetical protein
MSKSKIVQMPSTEKKRELEDLYAEFDIDRVPFGTIREIWNVSPDKDENGDVVRVFMAIQDLAESPSLKGCSMAHFVTACLLYTEHITRAVVNETDAAAKSELLEMLRA